MSNVMCNCLLLQGLPNHPGTPSSCFSCHHLSDRSWFPPFAFPLPPPSGASVSARKVMPPPGSFKDLVKGIKPASQRRAKESGWRRATESVSVR